jgi:hypothetical protein
MYINKSKIDSVLKVIHTQIVIPAKAGISLFNLTILNSEIPDMPRQLADSSGMTFGGGKTAFDKIEKQ